MEPGVICSSPIEWKRRVCLHGCALDSRDCEGYLQAHHVITQQQLRRAQLGHLIWETRNGLCLCERHHRRHTNATERIPREKLRPATIHWAQTHGLGYLIDRYYPAVRS